MLADNGYIARQMAISIGSRGSRLRRTFYRLPKFARSIDAGMLGRKTFDSYERLTAAANQKANSTRYAGVSKGRPFFANIIARNFAGLVALAFRLTSCVLPGGS
jgi:hypothetical protein